MILLEALHIKHYVKDRLLLDVDQLHILQKDRIGLVGRNGCGKTTLLNIFAEKIVPEEGTVIQRTQCTLLPQLKRTDTTKSGGEVTQEYIQKALMSHPELLLADEPTTNLDTDHIEWLEKKLSEWQGAFVIVSHDRAFLDALCTTIWEINEGKLKVYTGNYSDYARQKEIERTEQQSAYESYEKKKRQLEEALKLKERKAQRATKKPKNLSGSEARITGAKPYFAKKQKKLQQTANAIETRLEKLEKVENVKELQPLKMNLPNAETFKNRIILRVEDVSARFGKRELWHNTSFFIRGGDKLAIVGPNGSGKTTLVKKIMNQDRGVSYSPSMKLGYFNQNLTILDEEKSIIDNVRATSKQEESLIRTVLARMHFFGEDVYKPVGVLSGGERVKVALTKVFLSDMNTLILDEPTNYLDMEAVAALESLLKDYEGSVIFVSHDRRFIENIATRILEIRSQTIHVFEGTYRQWKNDKPKKVRDDDKEKRLVLETKITEVLSRLSIEPSPELEEEFQRLLKEKREMGKPHQR
ncbi:Vga family ABC-F type ribosomal protection protein [Sporolactobacillus laevolacticus]|uniref:ABC transporter n=1 Tax=Sporolactobacillus laevolacticus DSM 442 TaxID=1395513 RepID=V6IW20_9BACL|nr:Vga family ABC-F type ribosomal protection protein [Sporolactobacillus laevolacticus]EST11370.1 ABC transporter [Sporolactobacillus laevolacticus DSM 442]